MNTIGIALVWCVVQVTLLGLLAGGLYLLMRRLRPAAAASVVFTGLVMVVVLSLLALSPWPRWTISSSPLPLGEGQGVRAGDQEQIAERESRTDKAQHAITPAANVSPRPLAAGTTEWSRQGVRAGDQEQIAEDESRTDEAQHAITPATNVSPRPLAAGTAEWSEQGVRAEEPRGTAEGGKRTDRTQAAAPADAPPAPITLLWNALRESLSQPQAATNSPWPTAVAVLLLAMMACGLGWLLLGVAAVRWQRLQSQPVLDRELLELVDVLRAELRCVRPVEVRQSDDLVTAATIGWRQPVILLPSDWQTWTVEQRHAVLAHEIAHARSHDFLALLFAQLGLTLHFYHPLLHWLTNRLRLEQELAADAAAADVSGGQRQYLTTIAELALHNQDRPLSWPARTFLPTQTTFLRRIAMLRDSKLHFDRPAPVARYATIVAVLLCAVLVAGLRGPGNPPQALAADAAKTADEKPAAANTIIEGVGWKDVVVGMSREGALKALGQPDNNAARPEWLVWKKRHIECSLHQDSGMVGEVRFNPGFAGTLANGLKVGGPDDQVLKLYGKPSLSQDQGNGARKSGYFEKGILFWTYQGKISQIVVFKPYKPEQAQPQTPAADAAKAADAKPAASNAIIEGVGWKDLRVEMSKEDAIKALGKPDDNSRPDLLRWQKEHVECGFFGGDAAGATEIRFVPGFQGSLPNGIKLGSPGDELLKLYGEPSHTRQQDGAKFYGYTEKGILFWTRAGKVTMITAVKPSRPQEELVESNAATEKDAVRDAIIEGVGCKDVRVGMSRENIIKALGKPDSDSQPGLLQWKKKRIQCGFFGGDTAGATEIRFLPGFHGSLPNGIKLGSSGSELLKLYDKPSHTREQNGAKFYEYSEKGLLFWTDGGRIIMITAVKPSRPRAGGPDKSALWATKPEKGMPTPQTAPKAENILTNPSAENGEDYAADWGQGAPIEGVKYVWDKKVASEGKASLCIQKSVNNYFPIAQWSQTVKRTGELPVLEVSAQVKAKKMYKATVDVVFLDEDGEMLSHKWAAYIGAKKEDDPPADHDWKKYSGTVKIPEGTAKIRIALQDYGPGTVWFDDIQARYAAAPAETAADLPAVVPHPDSKTVELKYDDGKADGKHSSADSGEMIEFTRPETNGKIKGIRIFGARYGYPQAPAENFSIYVLGDDLSQPLFTETAPYRLFERGKAKWVDVKFKQAHEVPKKFSIALDFKAQSTKGVFVSHDNSTGGKHSKLGLPGQKSQDYAQGDWMIRVVLSADGTPPQGKGKE